MAKILEKKLAPIISLVFVFWGLAFIYRSSIVAIDGHRYFSLVDDAMISMRYAWNFSHGLGLVWNCGERVEGYTNLLMVLWMAAVTLFFNKSIAVLIIQLSGIPFMLGTAWLTMKIAQITSPGDISSHSKLIEVLAFIATLSYYPLVFWTLTGMETGLLAFWMALAVFLSLLYQKKREAKYLFCTALALGMAYLTRNDSLIFAIVVFTFLIIATRQARMPHFRGLSLAVAVYAVFIVAQTAFRYFYYGQLLPNTYVLKLVGMPILERLRNGAGFLTPFLLETSLLLILVLLGMIWKFGMQKLYLTSFILASLAYELYAGGDYSNYWRIMAPTMPMLFVVLIQSVAEFVETHKDRLASGNRPRMSNGLMQYPATAMIMGAMALLVATSVNLRFLNEIFLLNSLGDGNQKYVNLAVAINTVTTTDASVGVIRAGIIPYYADRKAIDFLGKSDPYIASLPPDISGQVSWNGMNSVPGHNKYDLDYSIKLLRPTYAEGFEWGSQNLNAWAKDYYVEVKYNGIRLDLLRNSPFVYWNMMKPVKRK